MKVLILFFLVIGSVLADSSELILYENRSIEKPVKLIIINGSQISDSEACRKKTCEAARIAQSRFTPKSKIAVSKGGANPSAQVCMNYGGKHLVYYLKNKNEISICEFKDKSFMLGWDLVKLNKGPL